VLLLANGVSKAEIDEFRVFFFDQSQNIGGGHLHPRKHGMGGPATRG
jgi:hypothetical protein